GPPPGTRARRRRSRPTKSFPAARTTPWARRAGRMSPTTSSPGRSIPPPPRPHANTDRKEGTMQAKPNVVLVHGAFADGSSWSKVIQLLQAAGHRVIVVQLELAALADDSATTRTVLAAQGGPTT